MTPETNVPTMVTIGFSHNNDIASNENQFGFQEKLYSRTQNAIPQNKNNRLDNLTTIILNKSVDRTEGIHPRIFCRRWFGLSAIDKNGQRFTEEQILAMESEYGYREKCINLLAKLLKIKPNTIHRWGKGLTFDKIPADKLRRYEIYLGYIDAIKVLTMSLGKLDEATLLKLLQKLETRCSDRS